MIRPLEMRSGLFLSVHLCHYKLIIRRKRRAFVFGSEYDFISGQISIERVTGKMICTVLVIPVGGIVKRNAQHPTETPCFLQFKDTLNQLEPRLNYKQLNDFSHPTRLKGRK